MEYSEIFGPMLLDEKTEPFDDEDYIYELKFDGFRTIIHASPEYVRIFSRNGHDVTELYPELISISSLVKMKTVFDGEIVSFKDGIPSFSNLQRRNTLKDLSNIKSISENDPIAFVAFDILYEGKNLTNLPLLERKKILNKYEDTDVFVKSKYISKNGKKLFSQVVKLDLEGIVAKRCDSLYYPNTRTKDWIKIKNFKYGTFLIGGFTINKVKASLLLGEKRDKKFYYIGKISICLENELFKRLKNSPKRKSSPFTDYEEKDAIYVTPKYSCEVEFIEWTPSRHLRQPVLKRIMKG